MENFNSAKDGRKAVTSAGAAEPLASDVKCRKVDIMAFKDNVSGIAVGGLSVIASAAVATGTPLDAGQSTTIFIHNLNKIGINAEKSGEGASYMYFD